MPIRMFFVVLAAGLALHGAFAAEGIRQQRVSFKAGTSSVAIKNSIKGDETIDYLLGAKAGQTLSVTLQTSNASNYFNVLPPGSETALFIGSTSGNTFSGTLPADGDYTVRVFLMRNAARRNETATYTLTLAITGAAAAAPAGDAKVAGTPFHATGSVPCSVGIDPKGAAQCAFGVIRSTPGNAEVHLAAPGDDVMSPRDKVLVFTGDKVTSTDAQAKVTAEKHGDEWSVGINGTHFYVIPEAVIVGG